MSKTRNNETKHANTEKHHITERSGENRRIINDFDVHDLIFNSDFRQIPIMDYNIVVSQCVNESDNNMSSSSTLNIDDKVNAATAGKEDQEKNDLKDLQLRLKKSEEARNELQHRLIEAVEEKQRALRRIEIIGSAHESRITEMHCVIAELTKKLRSKQNNTIFEETEPDFDSEISFQEVSPRNSESNFTNPEADASADYYDTILAQTSSNIHEEDSTKKNSTEELQEEIFHLRAQIALLQSQIATSQIAINPDISDNKTTPPSPYRKKSSSLTSLHEETESTRSPVHYLKSKESLLDTDEYIPKLLSKQNVTVKQSNTNSATSNENLNKWIEKPNQLKTPTADVNVSKMAERVKLRRNVDDSRITGADIVNTGIKNSEIAEHLCVSDMIQSESLINDSSMGTPVLLQSEIQRLQRRIDHLKAKNTVLTLTIDEFKENCEHLYLLCGKYESNAVALQVALSCSDRAIEAYDVMLALLESKLAMSEEMSLGAEESRKAVEAVARHLLDRLECEKNINENSLGPWRNTICISSTELSQPWTQEDDERLRNHVSKLKGQRSVVQNTVVALESPFCLKYKNSRILSDANKSQRQPDNKSMDLEMAVLLQELMSLREDVADAKMKWETAEREKNLAIENSHMLREELLQLQAQLADSESLLAFYNQDRSSYMEAEQSVGIERQLVEALSRESQLKNRIQTLVESVTASKKLSDKKYSRVQKNLSELQKAKM